MTRVPRVPREHSLTLARPDHKSSGTPRPRSPGGQASRASHFSNAWIYFLDSALPEHARAKNRMAALLSKEDALIPAVVQMEVVHYLVARMGADAADAVDTFLAFPGDVEPLSGATVGEAARLLLAHRGEGIGGRDASLLVIAQRRQAALVTADSALAKVAKALGVKVLSPTA